MFIRQRKKSDSYYLTFDKVVKLVYAYINDIHTLTDQAATELQHIVNIDIELTQTQLLQQYIKPVFKSTGPTSISYWVTRGWPNPAEKVQQEQRRRSKRCVEYWVERGYSVTDAEQQVSLHQAENFRKLTEKAGTKIFNSYSVQKYIDKGCTRVEAQAIVDARKLQTKIVQSREYLKSNKGYTDAEVDTMFKSRANKGRRNGMFNKSPALTAGASISGTFNGLYFRSTLELFFLKFNEHNQIICCDVPLTENAQHRIIIDDENYLPDYLIDGVVYEVKNSYAARQQQDKYTKVAQHYKNNEIVFKLVTECDIPNLLEECWHDYQAGKIQFANSKKLDKFIKQVNILHEKN